VTETAALAVIAFFGALIFGITGFGAAPSSCWPTSPRR
jgi:hypothetical protein